MKDSAILVHTSAARRELDKALTIEGNGLTVVDADGGNGFEVIAADVTLRGLIIRNTGNSLDKVRRRAMPRAVPYDRGGCHAGVARMAELAAGLP